MPFDVDDDLADENLAETTNDRLLMAVHDDNEHDIVRAMEQGWHAWLGSSWAQSIDEHTNPVLLSMVKPGGHRCLEAFQRWGHDVHLWSFGPWSPIHWAVAARNEDTLVWALEHGASITDLEKEGLEESRTPRRSALGITASMGDPEWLARVVSLATSTASTLKKDNRYGDASPVALPKLIRSDYAHPVSALGIALYNLAVNDHNIALSRPSNNQDWEGCIKVLADLGFSPDSKKSPGGLMTCALALSDPNLPHVDAFKRATMLAFSLGSGQSMDPEDNNLGLDASAGIFERIGATILGTTTLDQAINWRKALELMGFREGHEHGCWAIGVSRALRHGLLDNGSALGHAWTRQEQRMLSPAMQASFDRANVAPSSGPMHGEDSSFLQWLVTDTTRQHEKVWVERIILLDAAVDQPEPLAARARQRL